MPRKGQQGDRGFPCGFSPFGGVFQATASRKGAAGRDHWACVQAGRGGCPLRLHLRDRVSGPQLWKRPGCGWTAQPGGGSSRTQRCQGWGGGAEVQASVQSLATKLPYPQCRRDTMEVGCSLGLQDPSHSNFCYGRWEERSGRLAGQPGAPGQRRHGCSLPPAPMGGRTPV